MKKFLLLPLVLVLFLSACGSSETTESGDDPKEVAQGYVNALSASDWEGVCERMTEESQQELTAGLKVATESPGFDESKYPDLPDEITCAGALDWSVKVSGVESEEIEKIGETEVSEAEIDGDKATVSISGQGGLGLDEQLELVETDSGWKVDNRS